MRNHGKIAASAALLSALTVFGTGFGKPKPSPSPTPTPSPTATARASFKKVFVIVLENTDAGKALKQPYLKKISTDGAYLDQFYATTHPSQPNYISMISGDTQGFTGDGNKDVDAQHLGDLLEAKGKTWRAYNEGFPGGCFLGATSGRYARKHEPFISFKNVQSNPARCANIVDSAQLKADVASGNLADYSLYVPDLDNDGHDTGVSYADQWLKTNFEPLFADPRFMQDMLVVVTFDESSAFGGNHIYAALLGDSVVPGAVSQTKFNFYSLLRTIEDTFELGSLRANDASATPITGVWR